MNRNNKQRVSKVIFDYHLIRFFGRYFQFEKCVSFSFNSQIKKKNSFYLITICLSQQRKKEAMLFVLQFWLNQIVFPFQYFV